MQQELQAVIHASQGNDLISKADTCTAALGCSHFVQSSLAQALASARSAFSIEMHRQKTGSRTSRADADVSNGGSAVEPLPDDISPSPAEGISPNELAAQAAVEALPVQMDDSDKLTHMMRVATRVSTGLPMLTAAEVALLWARTEGSRSSKSADPSPSLGISPGRNGLVASNDDDDIGGVDDLDAALAASLEGIEMDIGGDQGASGAGGQASSETGTPTTSNPSDQAAHSSSFAEPEPEVLTMEQATAIIQAQGTHGGDPTMLQILAQSLID